MRVDPSEKAMHGDKIDAAAKARVENITRKLAIIVCFLFTFGLMVKILFL